jgi:hypothetical protein
MPEPCAMRAERTRLGESIGANVEDPQAFCSRVPTIQRTPAPLR